MNTLYVSLSLLSSPLPLCLPSSLLPLSFKSFMFNLMISVKQWHWLQLLASGYRQMEPFNYWIGILHNNKTSSHKLLAIQTQWKVLHTHTHTVCDTYILTMSVCLCVCVYEDQKNQTTMFEKRSTTGITTIKTWKTIITQLYIASNTREAILTVSQWQWDTPYTHVT